MPLNKNFARRIEILDQCLRARQRKFDLQGLIDFVNEKLNSEFGQGASKKTIQDDLKYLKEQGAPIIKVKEGTKWIQRYDDANYSIKNLPVNSEDVSYLRDALSVLKQVSDFKIFGDVDSIITKLENTLVETDVDSRTIIQFEKQTQSAGQEHLDNLFTAIKERCALKLSYHPFHKEKPDEFVIHPYLLKEYRNRWFLFARNQTINTVMVYPLDRIKKIGNCSDKYIENDLFDPETYFQNLIGVSMPHDGVVENIRIKVSKETAPYVLTKPIHFTQEVKKKNKDGSIVIELTVYWNYEAKANLLYYGKAIEVLSPKHLHNLMKEEFEKANDLYR